MPLGGYRKITRDQIKTNININITDKYTEKATKLKYFVKMVT
jgi:hypothetical protein